MLGSIAEAEDVVQDAFLRWNGAARGGIEAPRAFLIRTVTRLCLDRLKSARAQREQYVGTWLPEPLVEQDATELAHDLSMALLVTLQRLSPLKRAAFLLHDVFDMPFTEVAGVLERTEPAVRHSPRARGSPCARSDRASTRPARRHAVADAFQAALTSSSSGRSKLLAAECLLPDGGGKRRAALNPIHGRDAILRFFAKLIERTSIPEPSAFSRMDNGMPGFVVRGSDGLETMALEICDGLVTGIYAVRNPDKLRHLFVAPVRHEPGVRRVLDDSVGEPRPDVVERDWACREHRPADPAPHPTRGTP